MGKNRGSIENLGEYRWKENWELLVFKGVGSSMGGIWKELGNVGKE